MLGKSPFKTDFAGLDGKVHPRTGHESTQEE
jgi:hypothetical protein